MAYHWNPLSGKFDLVAEPSTVAGPAGPSGPPGPPGGFETVAVSTVAAGVWQNVPLTIIVGVVDVVVYDQSNREKVEIDTRINIDNTVDIRSSLVKTYTVHVLGY